MADEKIIKSKKIVGLAKIGDMTLGT